MLQMTLDTFVREVMTKATSAVINWTESGISTYQPFGNELLELLFRPQLSCILESNGLTRFNRFDPRLKYCLILLMTVAITYQGIKNHHIEEFAFLCLIELCFLEDGFFD